MATAKRLSAAERRASREAEQAELDAQAAHNKAEGTRVPDAYDANSADADSPIAGAEEVLAVAETRSRRAKGPTLQASAALLEYLAQFQAPQGFPLNYQKLSGGRHEGMTLDSRKMMVSAQQWNANLNAGRPGISYFGHKYTKDELVRLVSELPNANRADDTDVIGIRFFKGERDWYIFMLTIAEKIWEGELNPPGINFDEYPDRRTHLVYDYDREKGQYRTTEDGSQYLTRIVRTDEVSWRFRQPQEGLVHHAFLSYVEEADKRTRGDRSAFERVWVQEFVKNNRAFTIRGAVKTMDDFRVSGRPGTPEEFRKYWRIVSHPRYQNRGQRSTIAKQDNNRQAQRPEEV